MEELPSGTVTLLFSDVEGSTLLLSRLGPAYADALDGQRKVLRSAWAAHGGRELGTEGDSFFVVFPTAEGAVGAAAQAQRELAECPWPGGERVRVRIGIHTGSPTVHDGGYVGMDVHRAARIAAAVHGGQVVLSAATAGLVSACLPPHVGLRDLGSHQLKDIAVAERLFQLGVEGLGTDFPPLRTLGTASSLPVPVTSLVGRDGEMAELAELLGSPGVRLVTLTGPGGTGKTRLAVGLAQRLVGSFPDGVYFVPLATVTTAEVMWTSVAEVLDIPPEGRIPPGFFAHVAHRSALFVMDNLEQLSDADRMVSELLAEAPQVVVVITSRRPLHVAGEHQHPVPTLELPDQASLQQAERSGAVQLFVQHAKMVRPSFTLTADNTTDVVRVCRALDGLPLAIELAAARSKLLSPAALVARLDNALELKDTSVDRPTRQQTLRDTIAWSHDLLSDAQQVFFRRLGVFVGGADLAAVEAVVSTDDNIGDALEVLADLVDASLTTVTDGPGGEPRVAMLETIRAFAHDRLAAAGELDAIRRAHAEHYLRAAEVLSPLLLTGGGNQILEARRRLETELDNLRAALIWTLHADDPTVSPRDQVEVGLQLCSALGRPWADGGYYAEGRRWLELAVAMGGDRDSSALAGCLSGLVWLSELQGDLARSQEVATQCVAMLRRLGDYGELAFALGQLAVCEQRIGDLQAAHHAYDEAVTLAGEVDDKPRLACALADQAGLEQLEHNYDRSVELLQAAAEIFVAIGDERGVLLVRHNMACTLREMGRVDEAERTMRDQLPQFVRVAEPVTLIALAEDYAAALADSGCHQRAIRLLGAAEAMRERNGTPRDSTQQAQIEAPITNARAALTSKDWDREYELGRRMTIEDGLMQAYAASTKPGT